MIDADLSVRWLERGQEESLAKFNFAPKKNHTKSTPAVAPENNQNKIWIFLCSTHPKANRVRDGELARWRDGPSSRVYQSAICLAGCGGVIVMEVRELVSLLSRPANKRKFPHDALILENLR